MSNYIEYTIKVYTSGSKFWYLNDQFHREDGPACEHANGSKSWYLNGELHRKDGPACEWANGSKSWYLNGELHRKDGPACEHANGTKSWYLNGKQYTEEEYNQKMNPTPSCAGKIVEIDGKRYRLEETETDE